MKKRMVRILACFLVVGLLIPSVAAMQIKSDSEPPRPLDEGGNDVTGKAITLLIGEYYELGLSNAENADETDHGYIYYVYNDNGDQMYDEADKEMWDDYEEWWDDYYDFYTIIEDNTWLVTSSNPDVATVDEQGIVHALSVGQTTITMECYDLLQDKSGATAKAGYVCKWTIDVKERNYHNPFENIDPAQVENPFSDVSENAWYYDYIMYLYAAGMYEGVDFGNGKAFSASSLAINPAQSTYQLSNLSNSVTTTMSSGSQISLLSSGTQTFQASSKENRANTVTMLYNGHKSSGGTVGSYTNNIFTDVSSDKSYYQPVLWASATNTVNGYGDGLFGPLDGVTREQFCAILVRYAYRYGFELPSSVAAKTFTDSSSISSWAKDAVSACQQAGIIEGMPDGSFQPKSGITRAEISAMIYRFFENCAA